MAKWTIVDNDKAPENLSKLDAGQRERLEIIRALEPGKTIVIPVPLEAHKSYKTALSRVAGPKGMNLDVEVYSDTEGNVCIRLKEQTSAVPPSEAKS